VKIVLVVDDDELLRWALREALRRAGFDVREAGDARQARLHLQAGVDLVLLDLQLPDGDGRVLFRELRANHPDCPAILMTASPTRDDERDARALGALHYTGKPFDLHDMIDVVRGGLGLQATNSRHTPGRSTEPRTQRSL